MPAPKSPSERDYNTAIARLLDTSRDGSAAAGTLIQFMLPSDSAPAGSCIVLAAAELLKKSGVEGSNWGPFEGVRAIIVPNHSLDKFRDFLKSLDKEAIRNFVDPSVRER